MERTEFEDFLKTVYGARVEGNMEALGAFFAENAIFQIAGSPEYSMLAARAEGHEAVMGLLQTVSDSFELSEFTLLDMIVEGSKAAIRWRVCVINITSGDSFTTELADFIEVQGGKIISINEFLDTALAG